MTTVTAQALQKLQ